MTDPKQMLEQLGKPFPPNAIEKREGGGGKMLDYVATETVIRRLNNTVGVWDFRVTETKVIPMGEANLLVVWGEMTIPGLGTRSGTGVQILHPRGGEDMWKGAASDCLKKCATLFGVAIDLYGPDLESGELPKQNNLPPRQQNTSQNTVPQNHPNNQVVQARAGIPPTDKQFGMVGAIAKNLGMTPEQLHQFAGVDSLNQLDRAQVSDLIGALQKMEQEGGYRASVQTLNQRSGSVDDLPGDPINDWTAFWVRAMGLGYERDGEAMEKVIGQLGANPQHALDRLLAVQVNTQRAMAS